MTGISIWQLLTVLFSFCALVISMATYNRAGKWRESEQGKALVDKVNAHGQTLSGLTNDVGNLERTVVDHGQRLAAGEERFNNLATKADLAELKGDIGGLKGTVGAVREGVSRIEAYFLEKGVK